MGSRWNWQIMHNCPAHYQLIITDIVTDWKVKQMTITEPKSHRAGTFCWVPHSKVHVQSRWAWFFGSVSKLLPAGIQFVYIWVISFHFKYDFCKLFHLFRASFLPHFKHVARFGEGLRSRVLLSNCMISLSTSRGGHCFTVPRPYRPIAPLQDALGAPFGSGFLKMDSYVEAPEWSLKRYAKL